MHFVFLVPPISARGSIPLYLWVCLKWLHSMRGKDCSIGLPAAYLDVINRREGWEFEEAGKSFNEYDVPDGQLLEGVARYVYDQTTLREFAESMPNPHDALWSYMHESQLGRTLYVPIIEAAKKTHGDIAVVTWLNCESLKRVCAELNVPVIFNEIGPLRKPYYQHTAYFDFNGVNGGTSVARDWQENRSDFIAWAKENNIDGRSLHTLLAPTVDFNVEALISDPDEIGLALQVEDDSNAIAFAQGWSPTALISYAERTGLSYRVRMHPLGLALYRGVMDQSPSSLHFLLTCKEIWTVNSALGVEAVFWGKPVRFFGESTIGLLDQIAADERQWASLYYFLCYLIPYGCLFNAAYYKWRLTHPSAGAIAAKHAEIYAASAAPAQSREIKSIRAGDIPEGRILLDNPVRDALYLKRELDDVRVQLADANAALWATKAELEHLGFELGSRDTALVDTQTKCQELATAIATEQRAREAAWEELKTRKAEYQRQVETYEATIAELRENVGRLNRIARHLEAIYRSRGWRFLQRIARAMSWRSRRGGLVNDTSMMVPEPLSEEIMGEFRVEHSHDTTVEPAHCVATLSDAEEIAYSHAETTRIYSETPREMHNLFGGAALHRVLQRSDIATALDVGSGSGEHARWMAHAGISVTCVDFGTSVYARSGRVSGEAISVINGDYLSQPFDRQFDLVWASHVLEHQRNVGAFIAKLKQDCKLGGIIAITVPPLKHSIVGGHLSLWNAGLLLYNLAVAGIDCSKAEVLNYGYNISVIVQNYHFVVPPLDYDSGDIDRLAAWLPPGCKERFDGRMFGAASKPPGQ